ASLRDNSGSHPVRAPRALKTGDFQRNNPPAARHHAHAPDEQPVCLLSDVLLARYCDSQTSIRLLPVTSSLPVSFTIPAPFASVKTVTYPFLLDSHILIKKLNQTTFLIKKYCRGRCRKKEANTAEY